MKILYAIQATGNGHISRAHEILPHLQKYGKVDTMLSGANSSLPCKFDVSYKSKGLSLFYKKCGGLDYSKMILYNSLLRARKEAVNLPVENYDLIINDFDYITALACRLKGKASIQFGHQASFMSEATPRPDTKSMIGEYVLKNYAKASHYLGLHFRSYDQNILPPIIKESVLNAEPKDKGHITVYLPSYNNECLIKEFKKLDSVQFQFFTHDVNMIRRDGNIKFFPISNDMFTNSLINCHGIITGGGFETPAEALYLQKKIMSIPIRSHYEQKCNAAALKGLGVYTLDDIDTDIWSSQIKDWLSMKSVKVGIEATKIPDVLENIIDINECGTFRENSQLSLC